MLRARHFLVCAFCFLTALSFQNCNFVRKIDEPTLTQSELTSVPNPAEPFLPTPAPTKAPPPDKQNVDVTRILSLGGPVQDNYPYAGLAWGESYYLSSLLIHFELTQDSRLIIEFFNRADQVLKLRDDKSQRFTRAATWTTRSLYEPNFGKPTVNCSNVGLDGMILTPFAEFLTLYKDRPELFVAADLLNLNLKEKQDQLIQVIQQVGSYHQIHSWNSSLGTYQEHKDCPEVDSRNRVIRDFSRLPFNLIAAMGRVHFRLYLNNSDPKEFQRALSIAKDLRLWLKYGPSGELHWPYLYADSDPEDRSHGAIVVDFIRLLAEHGVIFSWDEVDSLDKTVRYQILGSSNVVMGYIGERKDIYHRCSDPFNQTDYFACRDLALWLPVIPYKNWTDLAKSFIHIDSGSFGILAEALSTKFSRLKGKGQTCSHDGECSTGSCFARNICGYKLGLGSTCQIDSDCHSGHCYSGKVCGQPLGTQSTCTRHHECVSGLCIQNGSIKRCQ